MKKVIFIVNSMQQPPCHKRIQEFMAHGIEVEAYGFSRGETKVIDTEGYTIHELGKIESKSYAKRLPYIKKQLQPVIDKYKNDKNAVFYFFMMDCALAGILAGARRYIYEIYDTMELTVSKPAMRYILKSLNKLIMRKALETVFTSEGFIECYFGKKRPVNISVIPNRINKKLLELPEVKKEPSEKLRIGFVGHLRYMSVLNFLQVVAKHKEIDFHIFGVLREHEPYFKEFTETINSADNITYHGPYKNPNDLPRIYSQLDMVLAVYPQNSLEVKYAEPNKLYEAIYFECPIIVSKGVFLGDKVECLGIGYTINAMNPEGIDRFVTNLDRSDMEQKAIQCRQLGKAYCINNNADVIRKIMSKLSC